MTGGAGYIGAHAVLALTDAGEEVVVLDDLSTGVRAAVPETATLVRGDIADTALVTRLIDAHAISEIMHYRQRKVVVPPQSVADPLGYYEGNTSKTRTLLATALAAGVRRVVFSSTAAVYGEPDETVIAEDQPLAPINPYGRSKGDERVDDPDAARAHGASAT